MKPENLEIRKQKITYFIISYLILIGIVCFCFYNTFWVVPRVYQKQVLLSNEEMQGFITHTNEADTLVMQMQVANSLSDISLVSFYRWTDKIEEQYKQPFFHTILKSYLMRVSELDDSKKADTTLIHLRKQLAQIKTENQKLQEDNLLLRQR
jgi:hypothetical protein